MGFDMKQKIIYKADLEHVLQDLTMKLQADLDEFT